jgi:hypothetical protein
MYPIYGLPTFPMLAPGFLGALAWLGASRRKVGSRPTLHSGVITLPLGHLFCSLVFGLPQSGVILHRGLLGALLCAAAPLANPPCSRRISEFGVSLAHERPRRPVIGHVLLRGHARQLRTISRAGGAAKSSDEIENGGQSSIFDRSDIQFQRRADALRAGRFVKIC